MRLFFQPNPINALVRGILTIGVGILFLSVPGLTLKSVIMTIGVMNLVNGLFTLLFSYVKPKNGRGAASFPGLFNMILGVLFLLSPMVIVKVFGFFFGFIFLLMGLMQFFGALGTLSKSVWSWVYLIFAILMTSGGLFLLVRPIESAENILTFFGGILLLYGFFELLMAWRLKKMPRQPGPDNTIDTTFEEV
jgi:uncharacterized membrane protein HdeD (DUF308 family)